MKEYKVYLVPHTHWDKEWYFTKEVSDVYLVDNMKNIIEANEQNSDESLFCWDGQYSIVDDYLTYFPNEREKIEKLIKNKKLIIGPWYSQTDTFNATGESIVRNLLIGSKLSEELGHSMKVAYLPDTFGFNSNLPQIIAKTNNIGIINWRGADEELINNSLFNLWEAEDGTKFPLYNLFRHGYYTGVGGLLKQYHQKWSKDVNTNWDPLNNASEIAKKYLEWVINEIEILKPLSESTGKRILIPIGSDQMPMVRGWKNIVNEMNKIDNNHEFILGDFENFMSEIINDNEVIKNAKVIKGQFRYGKYARAHKTINSSRYDIKKLSRETENLLYSELEPISVMYKNLGGHYPSELILEATKKLVASHAHDSLGGCNTDETNRAIISRLEAARAIIEGQITLIKKRIVNAITLDDNEIILWNLETRKCLKEFNIEVNTKKQSFSLENEGKEINYSIVEQIFYDNDNFKVVNSYEILDFNNKKYSNELEKDLNATNLLLEDNDGRFKTKINFKIEMPSFGYKIIKLTEVENQNTLVAIKENFAENSRFKVEVINNKINFYDKLHNIEIKEFVSFEAIIDAGDTYDFSPPKNLQTNIAIIEVINCIKTVHNKIQSLNIELTIKFNSGIFEYDNCKQKITLKLILKEDIIESNIEILNTLSDIRWRYIINSNIYNSKYSYADQSYSITKRLIEDKKVKISLNEDWVDVPIEIESNESLVYLKNENLAWAVFTNGNNEYQIIGDKKEKIALTLFRGVSLIGKRDLLYRKGRASGINDYPHATPESNLNKTLNFEVAISLTKDTDSLNYKSKQFGLKNVYYQKQSINQFQWRGDTFVLSQRPLNKLLKNLSLYEIKNINNLVQTALKQTWDKSQQLIRFYNPTYQDISIESKDIIYEVDLMENKIEDFSLTIRPNEIKTYLLKNKDVNK